MAVTKAELSETLMEEHGLAKRDAKGMVDEVFEVIRHCLEEGVSVKVSRFGKFELRDKGERPGRNPKTGEDVSISARRVVTFKPGQKLRARIETFEGVIDEEETLDEV
jgi:integration host factor subunit alpha